MTGTRLDWPDTTTVPAPADHPYASATWLLGRHPRLARLAARVDGVVYVEGGELGVDIDHLGEVIKSVGPYAAVWKDYERRVRPPQDDREYETWLERGPSSSAFPRGLSDFMVMSSGEVACLRILATFSSADCAPTFAASHLRSMDAEGQRLIADWCTILNAY